MALINDIVFDCARPASLARFWSAALDGYHIAPYDEAEMDRLRSMGIFDPEDDPSVLVEGPARQPRLWFTRVPEGKITKNRLHLDLRAVDRDREVQRLSGLGAEILPDQPNPDLVVMRDPEGNEFCVIS